MKTVGVHRTTTRIAFACIVVASGVARAGDEGDTLAGVAGFSVKVDPVDADGAEMGLTREGISAALEAGLRERELTVFSVQQLAKSKQGVGHPGVLVVRASVEKMPVGFAGFIQMRVVQEVLLRQGIYTVAATWHRDAQFTALTATRGRELVAELIGELLDVLNASYRAANARPRSATGGAPLNCKRWAMHGVRPSDDWPVAAAILRDPPDPKWSTESKFTRMSSWTLASPLQASVGLSVFGVRSDQNPWTVALLSTSYRAPVAFSDVVDAQRRVWGEPSRCGPEVKRFSIEAQGCFWQDNWCDTWAMVTELSGSKSIAVVLGTFDGWSQYQALLKQEDAGRKQGAR